MRYKKGYYNMENLDTENVNVFPEVISKWALLCSVFSILSEVRRYMTSQRPFSLRLGSGFPLALTED